MAFAGGAADKVGNEYETWWTLRRVTQLLRGEIDAIALEPLHGDGAELWVETRGRRTFDQVKYRSSGQWTPARLRSDGVLSKLGRHYAAGHEVLLVLSQPSEDLEKLIDLALATTSGSELWEEAAETNNLNLLSDAWGVGRDETRSYLTQTTVRHDGLPHLKEFVSLTLETLVLGNPALASGTLRAFLDARIARAFTASDVWEALTSDGFSPRPRAEPGPTIARLRDALDRHSRAVRRSAPNAGIILRREVDDIVEAVNDSKSPVVIVAGKAGAGKSVVVAEAAERLAQSGRHVAALRLDRLDPSTSTAAQLGRGLDLDQSPVVALSEVSPEGINGVLVIDQLDAVSNYSGRMPAVYDAVDEALNQARLIGNVRVILAVRSVDLAEDPRLRRLAGESAPTIQVGDLELESIRSYLLDLGTDVENVGATTLQLLRLPIHLYIFSELEPAMRAASYGTLTSLYSAFTRAFRARLERSGHPDEWPAVSRLLVERMNSHETLSLPASYLDEIRPLYVEALLSANVLVEQDGRIALFHETYFDYLFAKSFDLRGKALVGWFARTGQGLFRRSQLRQLLAFIATAEPEIFVEQVLAVATSSLRPHLVSIAYSALADMVPRNEDWISVRHLAVAENPFGARIVSLIGAPKWLDAADATGDLEILLDDPEWSEAVAGLVARLASERPSRVLELLSTRQHNGEMWIRAIRIAIDVADSPIWTDFALTQLLNGGLDLANEPFNVIHSRMFHRALSSRPDEALRLFVAVISRDLDRAIAGHSPEHDGILRGRDRSSILEKDLNDLATTLGARYVEALWPLITRIATFYPPSGARFWQYRVRDTHRELGDSLFYTFGDALTRMTRGSPAAAIPILESLTHIHSGALNFLVCRALHEASPNSAIDWLLDSEEHLAVGWLSGPRWETRRLIEHASAACSDDHFAALEAALLFWAPDYNRAEAKLRWRGLAELELLSALAPGRLSPRAAGRLAELRRKFPTWEPTEPEGMSGGMVQPPIARSAAEKMTDAQWHQAITKYANRDRLSFRDGAAYGGSEELASLMGTLAREDSERFLTFGLDLPPETPSTYTDHLVRNLAGEVPQDRLLPLIRKYRRDHPSDSGRAAAAVLDDYSQDLSDACFQELLSLADDVDPSREYALERTDSGFHFGGDFVSAGVNSTRGRVASTLAKVIFADESRLSAALPALHALANDPIVAVRVLAAEAILAYAASARDEGLDLLERLLDDDHVLSASTGLRALRWAMLWDADRFSPLLVRALSGQDAKLAGAHWANCLINDALGSAPTDVTLLSESARVGAADAVSTNPGLAAALVAQLFNDPSPEVRRTVARSVSSISDMSDAVRNDLVEHFLKSRSFENEYGQLLDALEDLPGELPATTWEACRRILNSLASSPRRRFVPHGEDLVTILIRLYRSSDAAGREAALDLIDQTVLLELWLIDEALDAAR
ncbi:hypothetical protein ACFUPZ_04705 [Microbacterium oxydans]|uniref:hypothetical protein n=1 Tax=Microbacterium oxydans TaxID=82380 RepID=UPI00362D9C80